MIITHIIIDVDGTLTDGGIYYDENGNELKKFNTRDAAGFFAARKAGIKTIVLTGRKCIATERRMAELGVDYLFQDVKNKLDFVKDFINEKSLSNEQIGYIGDDLNDLPAINIVGFSGCPADACREVKKRADYVSGLKGGYGAVRDVIEYLLQEDGSWNKIISEVYDTGI